MDIQINDILTMKKSSLVVINFLLVSTLFAEVWTPKIFSDNMVLQANEPVNIWGRALENADIKVEYADKSASTKADLNGNWKLSLPTLNYETEGKELKIYENASLSKTIKNVIVGEVWIAGGQSNMQYKFSQDAFAKERKQNFNTPLIRVFTQHDGAHSHKVEKEIPSGSWRGARPQFVGGFSAVGLYFAAPLPLLCCCGRNMYNLYLPTVFPPDIPCHWIVSPIVFLKKKLLKS